MSGRRCGQCREPGHNQRTCGSSKTYSSYRGTGGSSSRSSASSYWNDYDNDGWTTYRSPCPPKKVEPKVSSGSTMERDYNNDNSSFSWLNQKAQRALDKGPTAKDEDGYIYISKKRSTEKEDQDWNKIGKTKVSPEQRVRAQERNNGEEYDLKWSMKTPYHTLTEKIIKSQLEDCKSPKPAGDGKSEWFRTDLETMKQTAEEVKKEVERKYNGSGDRTADVAEIDDLLSVLTVREDY